MTWQQTALAVAETIRDDRSWSSLPVLADILEENGWQQEADIRHFRSIQHFHEQFHRDYEYCRYLDDLIDLLILITRGELT